MKRLVLTCSCHNMAKKATEAFSVLFPNEQMPPITKGRDRIYKLAKELGNDHVLAISKLSGKFAYYVELGNNNVITKEYNLITGVRVK